MLKRSIQSLVVTGIVIIAYAGVAEATEKHTVKDGETLWELAGEDWPLLWGANLDEVSNPHRIFVGQVLIVDVLDAQNVKAREKAQTTLDQLFEFLEALPDDSQPAPVPEPTPTPAPTQEPQPEPEPTATQAPAPAPAGGIVCPVPGASFSDTWGAPRSGGRSHQGTDLSAPGGTPTLAPVSGTVEHRESSLGGLSWFLHGDNGDMWYGAHLSRYGKGGRVVAGDVIGYVGATGNATGPHLHIQRHPGGGAPVNPHGQLVTACG